jgi:hypothetical protein
LVGSVILLLRWARYGVQAVRPRTQIEDQKEALQPQAPAAAYSWHERPADHPSPRSGPRLDR